MDPLHELGTLQGLAGHFGEECSSRVASACAAASDDAPWPAAALMHVVEQDIVPSLVRGHKAPPTSDRGPLPHANAKADVARFVSLLARGDAEAVRAYVEDICARHGCLESVYLDLIVPAARELAVARAEDRFSDCDITIGSLRLAQVVRELGARFPHALKCPRAGRRVLLVTASGQHVCGVFLVADFFSRSGWDVATCSSARDEAVHTVHDEWFDIVGLSVAYASKLDALAREVLRLRAASRNRSLGIMVGGAAFLAHPERVALVGADAMAADGLEAPFEAERLLGQKACD